jgi:hypothetical protein
VRLVVIGGAFAYIRFVRGRVLRASCEPEVEATEVTLPDSTRALAVTAIIKNNGSLRLVFPEGCNQTSTISRADAALWSDACQYGEVLWTSGTCHEKDLLTVEGIKDLTIKLEPGERIRRHLLIPVPYNHYLSHRGAASQCFAYKLELKIEAAPMMMFRTREYGAPRRLWGRDGGRRVPGRGERKALEFACPVPGCKERRFSVRPPECRLHRVTMVPAKEDSFPERRAAIEQARKDE